MSIFVDKPLSLIERKKQQWAKEREELAGLCAPWSSPSHSSQKSYISRNRFVSKLMTNTDEYQQNNDDNRRSSLPPLNSNNNKGGSIEKEVSGETSGYGSDNNNNPTTQVWCQQSDYESSSTFWESKDTPNWVKRGLKNDREIVVVANSSPSESPQQYDMDQERPYTSQSSNLNRSYIRGQNAPLDSIELAERERRRQIALAHQQAIKQQLEDREKRRKEERERKIKEEYEEELRIQREQEIERQRKADELKILKEKQEREIKRKEAIKEALETAEKEAQLEKIKLKMEKQNNLLNDNNNNNNNENKNKETEINKIHNNILKDNTNVIKTSERKEKINNAEQEKQHQLPSQNTQQIEQSQKSEQNNNFVELIEKPQFSSEALNNNNQKNNNKSLISLSPHDMTLVFQTPLETLQNMQYVLVSSSLNNKSSSSSSTIPIAVPVVRSSTPINSIRMTRTENRILTPTQYRNKNKKLVDSSTQTDFETIIEIKNNQNKDKNDSENRRNKGRTSRSEERVEDNRPKWGANRPPTRYLKQSEKDPLYQRKKLRQKLLYNKYDSKNSSDDSQIGSPRVYRKKIMYGEKKRRARWGHHGEFFSTNFNPYQSIIPLESDKEQIYYKCCCTCSSKNKSDDFKVDILNIEKNKESSQLPESLNSEVLELDKVRILHEDLIQKQERWERSPRTPSLSSSTRNTEN